MTDWRGPEHDRIAAEAELDNALDSGDAARIEAAQAALGEAAEVHNEALAQAEAEAEADWENPEPEPLEHRNARLLAFHDQAQAWAWNGNPAAEAAMAEFEAELGEPEAGL